MTRKQSNQQPVKSLSRQVADLARRMRVVEKRLPEARTTAQGQARHDAWAEQWDRQCERRRVETEANEARWKAINEFERQYWLERIRAVHPGIDAAMQQRRERLNAFLKARGMQPEPSSNRD